MLSDSLTALKYNPVPVQILITSYFIAKHNSQYEKGNIINFGQCDYCHEDARQGRYNKQSIFISNQNQRRSNQVKLKM